MKKIIIVEDDEDLSGLLKSVVQDEGYQVIAASTGSKFRQLIQHNHPDMVIMDINLPDTQGNQLSREFKQSTQNQQTPVLIISSDNQLQKKAKHGLADDYLSKPFELDDFVHKLNQLI